MKMRMILYWFDGIEPLNAKTMSRDSLPIAGECKSGDIIEMFVDVSFEFQVSSLAKFVLINFHGLSFCSYSKIKHEKIIFFLFCQVFVKFENISLKA